MLNYSNSRQKKNIDPILNSNNIFFTCLRLNTCPYHVVHIYTKENILQYFESHMPQLLYNIMAVVFIFK